MAAGQCRPGNPADIGCAGEFDLSPIAMIKIAPEPAVPRELPPLPGGSDTARTQRYCSYSQWHHSLPCESFGQNQSRQRFRHSQLRNAIDSQYAAWATGEVGVALWVKL